MSHSTSVRPLAITAICIIGFVNATQMISLIMSPMAKQLGSGYPLYFTFAVGASLICIGGLWWLKKWAAIAYAALLASNQLVLAKMGLWELSAVAIPMVIIVLLIHNRDKMG